MTQTQSRAGVAIVTGAAGGIGSPCANRLAGEGWPLLLCDLDRDHIERVAQPLRAAGTTVDVLAADVADPDFPGQLLAAVGGRTIGALIHTAGLSPTLADAARIWNVNYVATERLVAAVLPMMAEGSCAVLTSSSSAYMVKSAEVDAAIAKLMTGDGSAIEKMVMTPQGAYPISKRAVIALVARESTPFGKRRARIVSVAPGLIDTGMGRAEMSASPQARVMLERTPLQRPGIGDEIASVAVFLCSPQASYISGCDIKVDGGMLAALAL
jgi:NAD(P)-dependent dehydrogenase (short-subunit alcohol dehydrogenase family)